MKTIWLLTAVLAACPCPAFSQTSDELAGGIKDPANVTTQSMGYDRKNYSPLKEINKSNVKRLVPVWSTSTMNDAGELAAPTIYNGVMYVINGRWTFALDVETGRQIWRTPVEIDAGVQKVALFGAITRGAATIYNGKLYRITIDNHIQALDMKTGKVLWNQTFADWHEGYSATGAPIVANGVVISGVAGGEFTTRGFLDGWDPETGAKLWRRYTVPAPGEPGAGDGRPNLHRKGRAAARAAQSTGPPGGLSKPGVLSRAVDAVADLREASNHSMRGRPGAPHRPAAWVHGRSARVIA
jgi:alcohol dehydrogenase (cytochrome c)